MGKLHKIRKVIEAKPDIFMTGLMNVPKSKKESHTAFGAKVQANGTVHRTWTPHRNYVRKVLRDMGYNVN